MSLTFSTANGTITARADRITGDYKARGVTLEGHVVVHDGAVTLGSPSIHLHFSNNKVDRAIAEQKIVVDAPSGVAVADGGVYDVTTKTVTMTGNVVLTRDDNVIHGHVLRYNLKTGIATMKAGPGSRVRALVSTKAGR